MNATAVEHAYRYLQPSGFAPQGQALRLATCNADNRHPYFFHGSVVHPRRTASLLRALMQIVQARFFTPPAMLARVGAMSDPVVTCNDNALRFEGFSGCCGAYVRVDLLEAAIDGEVFGRGTTNVDFNQPMLSALAMIRDGEPMSLSVGSDELVLSKGSAAIIEKKVKLPIRWLRGFVEVQACQSRMTQVFDLPALDAVKFLRSLPRMNTSRRATFVSAAGRGLRISQVEAPQSVRIGGLERLRVLEGLAADAERLRIYEDPVTRATGWELATKESRFWLLLSPETWRGFSGEGQALSASASQAWKDILPQVQAALRWDNVIDEAALAERFAEPPGAVRQALQVLGARGLVGFDLAEKAFFHRELPFDLSLLTKMQPRLESARKLIDGGCVKVLRQTSDRCELAVASGDVDHRVVLAEGMNKCTCPWHAKHQSDRGPCKHVLAASMFIEEQNNE